MFKIIYHIISMINIIFFMVLGLSIFSKLKDNFYKFLVAFITGIITATVGIFLSVVFYVAGYVAGDNI